MTAQELAHLTADVEGFCWLAESDDGCFIVTTDLDSVARFSERYETPAILYVAPEFCNCVTLERLH